MSGRHRPDNTGKLMSDLTSNIAVYTGSFDPVTLGHLSVIERSSRIFRRVIVGVGINIDKAALFSPEERVELVSQATAPLQNVEVRAFGGLAVEFVRECGSMVMVRGVRPLTDIAAEFTMMMANRQLDPEIETVFLMADERFAHVSSSLIKQITPLSDNERMRRFLPATVIPVLRRKLREVGE
jgi:pantetheine-phosphate adenylyltransferase